MAVTSPNSLHEVELIADPYPQVKCMCRSVTTTIQDSVS